MAEKREEIPAEPSIIPVEESVSSQDPSVNLTSDEGKRKKEEDETFRQSKRRKNCPAALEKLEESDSSIRSFSFTFDTKIMGSSEWTPKFGSFNLGEDFGLGTMRKPAEEVDNKLDKIPPVMGDKEEEKELEDGTMVVVVVEESKLKGSTLMGDRLMN